MTPPPEHSSIFEERQKPPKLPRDPARLMIAAFGAGAACALSVAGFAWLTLHITAPDTAVASKSPATAETALTATATPAAAASQPAAAAKPSKVAAAPVQPASSEAQPSSTEGRGSSLQPPERKRSVRVIAPGYISVVPGDARDPVPADTKPAPAAVAAVATAASAGAAQGTFSAGLAKAEPVSTAAAEPEAKPEKSSKAERRKKKEAKAREQSGDAVDEAGAARASADEALRGDERDRRDEGWRDNWRDSREEPAETRETRRNGTIVRTYRYPDGRRVTVYAPAPRHEHQRRRDRSWEVSREPPFFARPFAFGGWRW